MKSKLANRSLGTINRQPEVEGLEGPIDGRSPSLLTDSLQANVS